ncbi:MAG: hypothetical protein AAF409_05890 [Pseudomonadota bacterium]
MAMLINEDIKVSSKTHLTFGTWYIGFVCSACDERVGLFTDSSNGSRSHGIDGTGMLEVRCPSCGNEQTQAAKLLVQFQFFPRAR